MLQLLQFSYKLLMHQKYQDSKSHKYSNTSTECQYATGQLSPFL